jgi:hypothetical protein
VRRAIALFAMACLSLVCSALPAAVSGREAAHLPKWTEWDRSSDDPHVLTIAGYGFTTHVVRKRDSTTPILTITAKGHGSIDVVGAEGMSSPFAAFLVFPLRAGVPAGVENSVVLFRSYTGGAHCCDEYKLIESTPSGWQVHELGQWDGSGPEPADIDHDGRLELVAADQRFDYRLASHAGSLMPPVVYEIRNGQLADVSTEARFIPFYRSKLEQFRSYCEGESESLGRCLGYVATASRAGEAKVALAVLDKRPEPPGSGPWRVPTRCGAPASALGCEHEKPETEFAKRHDAVVWFLTDIGYPIR